MKDKFEEDVFNTLWAGIVYNVEVLEDKQLAQLAYRAVSEEATKKGFSKAERIVAMAKFCLVIMEIAEDCGNGELKTLESLWALKHVAAGIVGGMR